MHFSACMDYLNCIEPLKAEEMLNDLQVAVFPNMKREKQKRVEKDLRKKARINSDKSPSNTEDLYYHLVRTLGNG